MNDKIYTIYNEINNLNLGRFAKPYFKTLLLLGTLLISSSIGNSMRQGYLDHQEIEAYKQQMIQNEINYRGARNAGAFFSGVAGERKK